ncbi:unnamed protein product [Rotaria sp. Silwood2]|nr:unnamed protein product [Rotaria sp. Silwood2]
MDNYEYMNISAISDALICEICRNPFINPVILPYPCERTYCLNCIQSNLEKHSNNCMQCDKKSLSNTELKNESPILRKMLDNLLVRCRSCAQINIQRSNFSKHIQQMCPKRIVSCSANDIQCSWKGHFDQLNQHFNVCPYEKLRTPLTKLINDVQRLDQLDQLQTNFQNLKIKFQQQQNQIEQIENENKILNEQINEMKKFEIEHKNLNEKNNEQINDINQLKNKNQTIQDQCDQYKTTINDLIIELKTLSISLQQANISIEKFEKENKLLQEDSNQLNFSQINYKTLDELYQQQQIQIDSFNKENQYLQEELLYYKQELEQLNQHFKQIQTENQQFHQRYVLYNRENNTLNEQNQQLNQQLIIYKKNLQQLNQDFKQMQIDNQQLKEQSVRYKIEIDELTIKNKRLEAKLYKPIIQSHKIADKSNYQNTGLEELINRCQTSSIVNLNGQKINDHDIDIVINTTLFNKQCQSLILWNNCLTSYSISKLFSSLSINTTLKKLSISKNHLSDIAIKSLSESLLFKNSTLKELVLSSNEITDEGLIYLSDMLKINETLIVLGLQDNKITDKAIQYLSQVIQFNNKTMEEISLYSNKLITDISIDYIFNMITNNQSLKTFWIWDCQLSEQGKCKLQQSIQSKIDFDLRL